MAADLSAWALPRLSKLLPIDDESLKEIITYTASLSKDAAADHLKNLLGDSPQALEFISSFNSRRHVTTSANTETSSNSSSQVNPVGQDLGPPQRKRNLRKAKTPLHAAGPVRRPDNYGDVSGGYKKTNIDDEYMPKKTRQGPSATALSDALSLSQTPAARQLPKTAAISIQSPYPSSSRDPSPLRQKLPPSASGKLTSALPNIKTKQSRKGATPRSSTPHRATTTTTSSIDDLTSAIAALELSTNPSLSNERRKCDCNATIHPLFAPSPNCLSCGKVICALEGLQPCSFCDTPILTPQQVQTMIRMLREERGNEKMTLHNEAQSGRSTPAFGGAATPESGQSENESAARALAHRDKLLKFQRENAQRTKIHDEAADYDMTLTAGATQWMSPSQRALALKKQQKYLREMEEQSKPEWERKKTVLSVGIKNGKVVRTYEKVDSGQSEAVENEVSNDLEPADGEITSDAKDESRPGAFSNNPLLASGSGLVRPVWKAPPGAAKGKERKDDSPRQKQLWRRVQDDNDDNEQWILDGGLHGQHDDGSTLESG
ncbi:MAG: hypothetical protein Q9160_001138 [Pyrenula sp. 1 TL-2023]